jgi:hypothetical protein
MKKIVFTSIILILLLYCKNENTDKKNRNPVYFKVVSNQMLNLRKLPAQDSNILDKIAKDQIIELLEIKQPIEIDNIKGNWYKIRYKEKTGFLFSGYLKPISEEELDFITIDIDSWTDNIKIFDQANSKGYSEIFYILNIEKDKHYISNEHHFGIFELKTILKETNFYAKDFNFNIFRKINNKEEFTKNGLYFKTYTFIIDLLPISDKLIITHKSALFKPTYDSKKRFDTYEYVYYFTDSNGDKGFIYESSLINHTNYTKKELSEKLLLNCMYGDSHITKIHELIESGADVNYADPNSGITPLIIALEYQNEATIDILLNNGADPNKKDFQNKSFNDYKDFNVTRDGS